MSKKRSVLLLALLIGALGVLVWLARSYREVGYQGKPLNAWLKDLEQWDGDTNDAAIVAFREMGTNAIPTLLNVLQSGGSPVERMIMKLNQKQSLVKLPFGTPWNQTTAATWALYAMGTNARPALPALTNMLFHSNALFSSTRVLAGIGSEGISAVLTALTNKNDRIRFSAASGLGWARSDFDVVVPALIARLQDASSMVQHAAVNSLGLLHARPEIVVPALMADFPSHDMILRLTVLGSIGRFEGKAREAVPMVEAALKDDDETVRRAAGFALKKIDPEAATKAGVK